MAGTGFKLPYIGSKDPSLLYSQLGGTSGITPVLKKASKGAFGASPLGPIGAIAGGVLGAVGGGVEAVLAKEQSDRLYELQLKALEEEQRQNEIQNKFTERKLGMSGIDMLSGMRNDAWTKYKKEKFQSDLARIAGA